MRTPCYCFHCCLVWSMNLKRLVWSGSVTLWPNHQLVVISSRGKILIVHRPLEANDLLFVTFKPTLELSFFSDVSVDDRPIFWSRREGIRVVPGYSSYSTFMALIWSDQFLSLGVKEVDSAGVCSRCEVLASMSRPSNWRHQAFVFLIFIKLSYLRAGSVPNVYCLA